MSKNWKDFERFLAKNMDGIRHPVTGRQGEFPDVETERFAVEAKTRRVVPDYLICDKKQIRVTEDGYMLMRLETFLAAINCRDGLSSLPIKRKTPAYIKRWMKQAVGFSKIPIVVIHKDKTRYSNATVVISRSDFFKIVTGGEHD